jgi:DNA-binding NtrC family response regulator
MPRILIVDDEPQYGAYLSDWLSRQGHEVKTATTSRDAIACGAAWRPHVLLIANWTPGCPLDGLQISSAVREVHPEVQTILIAGCSSPELRASAEKAQVFCLVEKPFSLEDLAAAVGNAARESRRVHGPQLLLVSETAVVLAATADMLQSAGWVCHVADSHAQARQTLENNTMISVAVLDCLEPTPDLRLLAAELRKIQPRLTIIGCSEQATDRRRFAELGITDFVPRYWEVADLVRLLAAAIENCVECGLPLPLLRATPGVDAQSWECGMCGARYRAVLREDATEDLRRNVRPAC